jgi:hypothetical protein
MIAAQIIAHDEQMTFRLTKRVAFTVVKVRPVCDGNTSRSTMERIKPAMTTIVDSK